MEIRYGERVIIVDINDTDPAPKEAIGILGTVVERPGEGGSSNGRIKVKLDEDIGAFNDPFWWFNRSEFKLIRELSKFEKAFYGVL